MSFITLDEVMRAKARKIILQAMLDNNVLFRDSYAKDVEEAVIKLIAISDFKDSAIVYAAYWNKLEMREQHHV